MAIAFRLTLLILLSLYSLLSIAATPKELTYQKIVTSKHQVIHVIEIPSKAFQLKIAQAEDPILHRDTIENIATNHNALAAINGGFFRTGNGVEGLPAGILKTQREWVSVAYKPRGAVGWSANSKAPLFDRIQTKTRITIDNKTYPLRHFNHPGFKRAGLYNHHFDWFPQNQLKRRTYLIQYNAIQKSYKKFPKYIPKGATLFMPNPSAQAHLKKGQTAKPFIKVLPRLSPKSQKKWQAQENILGGAPLLIHKGKVITDFSAEKLPRKFIYERHARSAIGWKKGRWVLVMVEQNPLLNNSGMTIPELAHTMKSLGCVNALNLDGGGSSALYYQENGKTLGSSSLREVANALIVVPK